MREGVGEGVKSEKTINKININNTLRIHGKWVVMRCKRMSEPKRLEDEDEDDDGAH